MAQAWKSGENAYYKTTASATNRTITSPGTWDDGDILVLIITTDESGMTLSLPTGGEWTQIETTVTDTNFAAIAGWAHRTGGADPNLTFGVGTSSSRTPEAHILAFSGVHTTTPITDSALGATASMNGGTNCDPPGITAGTSELVVAFVARRLEYAAAGATPPTGYTLRSNTDGSTTRICAGIVSNSLLSGAQDPGAVTNQVGGTSIGWHGLTFSLAAPAGADIDVSPAQAAAVLAGANPRLAFATTPSVTALTLSGQSPRLALGLNPSFTAMTLTGMSPSLGSHIRPAQDDVALEGQNVSMNFVLNMPDEP